MLKQNIFRFLTRCMRFMDFLRFKKFFKTLSAIVDIIFKNFAAFQKNFLLIESKAVFDT